MDRRQGEEQEHQRRLRERFLDLADAFVRARMAMLRRTGAQPPDERGETKVGKV